MNCSSVTLPLLHMKPAARGMVARPVNGRTMVARQRKTGESMITTITTPSFVVQVSSVSKFESESESESESDDKGQGQGQGQQSVDADADLFTKLQIQQVVDKQTKSNIIINNNPRKQDKETPLVKMAYEACRQICARSSTYYLGSLLMPEAKKKAVWAIHAWGMRTDALVDFANSNHEASAALDSWEKRLEDIFHGQPHDIDDTALADTFQRFPLNIKPFKDLIEGMRMDTWKSRYNNFEELELYSYYASGTACLMVLALAGISPEHESSTQNIYKTSLSLGVANQLTNILRDVGEDASMGRVYLPQDELRTYRLTDEDIFSKNVTDKWREFTKMQIARARQYYNVGGQVADALNTDSRWPVWASLLLYRKILDKIEENNYNLTKRDKVGNAEKFFTMPLAHAKAMGW